MSLFLQTRTCDVLSFIETRAEETQCVTRVGTPECRNSSNSQNDEVLGTLRLKQRSFLYKSTPLRRYFFLNTGLKVL